MTTRPLSYLVSNLRHAVLLREQGDVTDGQLVDCFVRHRDEAAFAALLRRHGPMVLGVCRRVAGNPHDADDAFQATFLVLVRKAAALGDPERVGSWLYGVAYRTALKARTANARRRQRERPLQNLPGPPSADEPEWRPLLDRAVSGLPDKYRLPVVLCELEGRPRREVARQLHLPEGTLSSRLATARRLLARRLTHYGLALGLAEATACVPAALAKTTVHAAALLAAGETLGVLSPPVTALMKGALRAMFLTKLKAAALLLAAGVVGSVVALSAGPALADKPKADGGQKKEKKEAGPSVRGTVKAADAGKRTLTVVVLIDPTKKETVEKTFPVAGDAKVVLEDVLTKTPTLPEGILADLTEGTGVTLELSADGKAVVRVSARGPSLHASVKVMDQATNTLTVTVKEDGGLVEKTLTVAKGAKVIMDDGLGGKKKEPPREGKLTDLTEGTPVTVQLSVNRQTALGIHVRGVTVFGTLKAYDAGNRFVTVTVKEDGQLVDKTFTLAKEAQLEGDLTSGAPVTIRLSVHDKMVAAAVQVRKDG